MAFANLGVSLTARTAAFSKGLNRARSQLSGFVRSARGAATRSRVLFAGLGAAITGGIVGSTISSVDSLAKMSDRLGIATEKLGTLRHAARLSGVGINQMDIGLQRMVRRVAEAAAGTGEAQAAIRELGLDATDLTGKTPDEQFLAIANAMKGVENQSERVRLAFKLFDSEGVGLVNTLRLVEGKGFRKVERQAKKLGIAIKRDQAEKFEEAQTQIDIARDALRGAALAMTAKMLPAIKSMLGFIIKLIPKVQELVESLKNLTPENVGQTAAKIVTTVGGENVGKKFRQGQVFASALVNREVGGQIIKSAPLASLLDAFKQRRIPGVVFFENLAKTATLVAERLAAASRTAGQLRTRSELVREFGEGPVRSMERVSDNATVGRVSRTTQGNEAELTKAIQELVKFLQEGKQRGGLGLTDRQAAKAG